MPKVAVIIPCFNQGIYIEEAIASVLAQSYTDWEMIIVNDGSTDEATIRILDTILSPKITIIHTENKGLPAARNAGISKTTAEYILPLDADDRIAPTYIKKALEAFENDNALRLVYCSGRYFGAKNESIQIDLLPFDYGTLLLYNTIFCSAIFRKTDFEYCGGYNINMKGGWEDWDLWIRLLKNSGRVYQIPEELFFYRVKETSMIQDLIKDMTLQGKLEREIFIQNNEAYFENFGAPISVYRELIHLRQEKDQFEKVKKQIYRSVSYRLGGLLLSPFKWTKKNNK